MVLRGLCLFLAMLLSAASLADTLRMAGGRWPPFADTRMPGNGFCVELVSQALQRAGFASQYAEVPWPRALQGVRKGDYDIVVDAWYNAERESYAAYSRPYLTNRVRLLKRKGSPITFGQLSDLYPYQIAVVRGYSYAAEFDGDPRLRKVEVRSFANAARMLHAGRVDLTLEDELVARHRLNTELRPLQDDLEFLPGALAEKELYIMVSRSNPRYAEILAGFDQAIREMRADGSYEALLRAYGL
ncbi:Lysine/arginine/ornithine-binding periplasmic protein [compost metagenome]|uniref:Polar amino acid transport system substrate-binding protein n=1 Tax=Pseudomonas jinjuensis TaxID=198616 RepID=A0A1H0IQ60_9PSED|nr:transporter substrate-binding domain-containing protein [Pseudomonas jinjuensis]SDO33462.1 polar amino acid transport system substrate-binding protein [Pseudomonas jinjuensis]